MTHTRARRRKLFEYTFNFHFRIHRAMPFFAYSQSVNMRKRLCGDNHSTSDATSSALEVVWIVPLDIDILDLLYCRAMCPLNMATHQSRTQMP